MTIPDNNGSIALRPLLGEKLIDKSNMEAVTGRTIAKLSAAYSLNFADANTLEGQKVKLLVEMAVSKKFTIKEFGEHLNSLIETCQYPTWTPADFFRKERAKLHNRTWYEMQLLKDRSIEHQIEIYEIDGVEWYHEKTGKRLPFTMLYPVCEKKYPTAEVQKPVKVVTPETKEEIDLKVENFKLKIQLDKLRDERNRYKAAYETAKQEYDKLKNYTIELENEIEKGNE